MAPAKNLVGVAVASVAVGAVVAAVDSGVMEAVAEVDSGVA